MLPVREALLWVEADVRPEPAGRVAVQDRVRCRVASVTSVLAAAFGGVAADVGAGKAAGFAREVDGEIGGDAYAVVAGLGGWLVVGRSGGESGAGGSGAKGMLARLAYRV